MDQVLFLGGIHRVSRGSVKTGLCPAEAGFSPEFQSFIQVGPDRRSLVLGNASFYITGFNNYYMHHYSVWKDDGRDQVCSRFYFVWISVRSMKCLLLRKNLDLMYFVSGRLPMEIHGIRFNLNLASLMMQC